MKKKLLSIILILALCFSFVPSMALAGENVPLKDAHQRMQIENFVPIIQSEMLFGLGRMISTPQQYGIWIGDINVTSENANDVFEDGTVVYNPDENVLYLKDANITNSSLDEISQTTAGIYIQNELIIRVEGINYVTAADAYDFSYGIYTDAPLFIEGDGQLFVTAGSVTTDSAYAYSVGIYTNNQLSIDQAYVNAQGGDVTAPMDSDGYAYSAGIYIENGDLYADFDATVDAIGGQAKGNLAYSSGIESFNMDNYSNIGIYDCDLTAKGNNAEGTVSAGSNGVYMLNGGFYVYDKYANVELDSATAKVVSTNETDEPYAYSNGIYVYAGDVGIDAGTVKITSGSYDALDGDGYAVMLEAEEFDGGFSGGIFNIRCDEVTPYTRGYGFYGTNVTIEALMDIAVYAQIDINISGDKELVISVPKDAEVKGQGEKDEETYSYEYYTFVDADGTPAENVTIEPLIYKVTIDSATPERLAHVMAVLVPAGQSVNETYCDLYGIEDFSEIINTQKDGYTFQGFYTENGEKFSFDQSVNSDMTITPKWVVEIDYAPVDLPNNSAGIPNNSKENIHAAQYSDIDSAAWYYDGILFCTNHNIMGGFPDDTFQPDTNTSRAMIVTIIWRLEGCPVVNFAMDYKDVKSGEWYAEAIRWAQAEKIVTGYGTGMFGPNDSITREQLAAILHNYAQYKGYDVSAGENTNILSYKDAFDISDWAYPALQWACEIGIINGIEDGVIAPAGDATRAQTAVMMKHYIEMYDILS